jgi:hypothetical protein
MRGAAKADTGTEAIVRATIKTAASRTLMVVRRRERARPDDAAHRRENHEATVSAASFERRARALLRMRDESSF